jgi:PKHD-type hydroxylase
VDDLCRTLDISDGEVFGKRESYRKSKIAWISISENSGWLFDLIAMHLDGMNSQYFGMDIYGFSQIQYTEYDASYAGKYDWHNDVVYGHENKHPGLHRKLSITVALNDDFEGGEFQITTTSEDILVLKPEMRKGSFLLFPSHLTHRVTPVTKGMRKSLVVWAVGPKLK